MAGIEEETEPFDCPRCGAVVHERLWGPCQACRVDLVAAYEAQQGAAVESSRYEPAMHVVPNHVATKD